MVKLVSFAPFQGASQALENINDISEGILSPFLHTVLETNLPQQSKSNVVLAVSDKNLAASIKEAFSGVSCTTPETNRVALSLIRGVRQHAEKMIPALRDGDLGQAQLGLGHAYSRAKVKFSVQKNDNHIIQAIATLDHLDKAVNTFAMRCREWYSWHFPELIKIVSDNITYARMVLVIKDKASLTDDHLHQLAALVNDDATIAQSIINAARVSMGRDISDSDLQHVTDFAQRTIKLAECRATMQSYLRNKMGLVAPNLSTLIGDAVAARLISKAGSLPNLSKYPASTVQILGAEKALFRALKTKGKTPKYGIIYNSSFIGKAGVKNKGRISRFLANKCSIASRIDNFSSAPNTRFGEALKAQVEERIAFYSQGAVPDKNDVAMVCSQLNIPNDLNSRGHRNEPWTSCFRTWPSLTRQLTTSPLRSSRTIRKKRRTRRTRKSPSQPTPWM